MSESVASRLLALILLLLLCLNGEATKLCWNPDGSPAEAGDSPCNGDSPQDSFCCPPGWACLADKVCETTQWLNITPVAGDQFYRGSCTDKLWASDACPNFCKSYDNGTAIIGDTGTRPIYNCPLPLVDVWRCSSPWTHPSDCDNSVNLTTLTGGTLPATVIGGYALSYVSLLPTPTSSSQTQLSATPSTTSQSSSTTQSQSSVSTSTTSGPPAPTSTGSSGLSTGAKIGLGVGIPLGLAICALLAFLTWRVLKVTQTPGRDTQVQQAPRQSGYNGYDLSTHTDSSGKYLPSASPSAHGRYELQTNDT